MAIFQRTYHGYDRELTGPWYRPWVIFRYTMAEVFSSRLFIAFFALCFVHPLLVLATIYMHHNIELLLQLDADVGDLMAIDAAFFAQWVQVPQMFISIVLITLVGPGLISPDLRNNAMPLYLSRAMSKFSYVIGKLSVLLVLGSCVTWLPALLLIITQSFLSADTWLSDHIHLVGASVVVSALWLIAFGMLSLAVSAWIKWRPIARMMFFGMLFMATILGSIVSEIFGSWTGDAVSPVGIGVSLTHSLYNVPTWITMPGWIAVMVLVIVTVAANLALLRRIRAFEVVS
ncbi:MAG: hypothetical protein AAF525_03970 [Pseudomonadota bacterium]